jgi:soluble lytic murein transglycosylase
MRLRRSASSLVALACAVLLPLPQAQGAAARDPYEKVREAFRQAYDQVDAPNARRQPDSAALRDYPLYPYLQAARIRRALAAVGVAGGAVHPRAQNYNP